MALNFQIPKNDKKQNLKTLQDGFGIPLKASLVPSIPNIPLGNFPEGITRFGTYYYDSLFIQAPSYEIASYNETDGTYTIVLNNVVFSPDFITTADGVVSGVLIKGCIVDVGATNNIVKTEIAGQNGTVKEYINQGDYTITIRGFFDTFLPDLHPQQRTSLLNYYCSAPVSLSIVNDFLNTIFKIDKIVVEYYNIFQQEGVRNVQYFQINAISDTDFVIKEESK
jgi:hypothetical protein